MHISLNNQISQLKSSQAKQIESIRELYLAFETLYKQYEQKTKQEQSQLSSIENFSPILIFKVTQYLKIKQIVRLRLLNRNFNFKIRSAYRFHIELQQLRLQNLQAQLLNFEQPQLDPQAQLVLEQGIQGLNQLSKTDITETKAFNNPPIVVLKVIKVLYCVLQNPKNDKAEWIEYKKFLGDVSLLDQMKSIDAKNIPEKNLQQIQQLVNEFSPQNVAAVSKACGSIYGFLNSLLMYSMLPQAIYQKKTQNLNSEIASVQKTLHKLEEQKHQ